MKVLIVGFGNMGCRHAQSILNSEYKSEIHVVEPNEQIWRNNLSRIQAVEQDFRYIKNIDSTDDEYDFAIVATSAEPRYDIMRVLVKKQISKFLLEKVVFQSKYQFDDIIAELDYKKSIGYCNFVNRYFVNYINLRKRLKGKCFNMIVSGSDFGMACNSLHYVDLFEYLSDSKSFVISHNTFQNDVPNKRGNEYKEITGVIQWANTNSGRLTIQSDPMRIGGNEITIVFEDETHILNESTLRHTTVNGSKIGIMNFDVKYTSELTALILSDIIKNECNLPTINNVAQYHIDFFKVVNKTLNLNEFDICPIT